MFAVTNQLFPKFLEDFPSDHQECDSEAATRKTPSQVLGGFRHISE